MDLLPKLRLIADAWVAAHQRGGAAVTLKTLGVRAVANSKLFERRGMSVETFEAVLLWLGKPENWPGGLVPASACEALCALGVFVPIGHWMPETLAA